ncbi:MAG: ZIP family metal transporter, partial [Anaerolineae bacterium]|nr:ZIP family metal transporter [Anaerolineae bacterium]
MENLFIQLFGSNRILMGVVATLLTGLFTGLGALPILFTKNVTERLLDSLLGFSAGVMLAATAFSLVVPGIEIGDEMFGRGTGIYIVVGGILLGALFLAVLDRSLPHFHPVLGREGPKSTLRRVWLLIIAITLHNFPEGLAVGVGFGAERLSEAIALMIAIALQNMPEGLAVALPLVREKWPRGKAMAY